MKQVFVNTLNQLLLMFGILFVWGLVLYLLARFTRRTYQKSLGSRAEIYLTAWIGTPIHELGHAIFCILFNHKILRINLFSPDAQDGTLGYVNHSYNPKSLYQQIGNLFIGIGPIVFGSIVLYTLIYFLVPSSKDIFASLKSSSPISIIGFGNLIEGYLSLIKNILLALFQSSNFNHSSFYIFLFISICISSHMELSPSDIKNFGRGFLFLIVLFLLINSFFLLLGMIGADNYLGAISVEKYQLMIRSFSALLASILLLSSIISATNFIVSFLFLSVLNKIRGKGLINPLW